MPEQHPSPTRLRALADDDLDRVGAPEVVGVHAVAGREELVDQRLRVLALLRRHAPVTGGGRRPDLGRAASEGLLRRRGERSERHSGDGHRDLQLERRLREPRAERDVRAATLAIALERIPRDTRTEEQKVVEVRNSALGAEAPDVVDALACRTLDLGDDDAVIQVRLPEIPESGDRRHQ